MVRRTIWQGVVLILLLAAVLLHSGAGDFDSPTSLVNDLDGDGRAEEYLLSDHTLSVRQGGQTIWESPPDWRVDSFALGDIDHDGKSNLVFSLWKKGSFQAIRPFWHTGEDDSYKNHLFVYEVQESMCKPVWCSSDLGRPILSFLIRDVDGDGLNELFVEEGQYRRVTGNHHAPDPDGPATTAVWQWEEWGFRLREPAL